MDLERIAYKVDWYHKISRESDGSTIKKGSIDSVINGMDDFKFGENNNYYRGLEIWNNYIELIILGKDFKESYLDETGQIYIKRLGKAPFSYKTTTKKEKEKIFKQMSADIINYSPKVLQNKVLPIFVK